MVELVVDNFRPTWAELEGFYVRNPNKCGNGVLRYYLPAREAVALRYWGGVCWCIDL